MENNSVALAMDPAKISSMAKEEKHERAPRVATQIPRDWWIVIRKLAHKAKQAQYLWYLLDLVAREADEADIDRPKLPWEEDADDE